MLKKVLLLLVFGVSVFFRFSGLYPGYPPYHSDEGISYSSAVSMIKNGNFDPGRYDYPALVPVVNYIVFTQVFIPFSWVNYYINNLGPLFSGQIKLPLESDRYSEIFQLKILGEREINALVWGRIVTAIFGIGVVLLTYKIGKLIDGFLLGLVSSFLVAVNYREVLNSHLGLPDIYNSFFLLLSLLLTFKLFKKSDLVSYLLSGISLGLSMSVKFQVFAFVPFLITHYFITTTKDRLNLKLFFNKKLFLAMFSALLLFILINPYLIINYETFLRQIHDVSLKYSTGNNSLDLFGIVYLYKFGLGPVLSLLFVVGCFFLAKFKKTNFLLLLSLLIPFFIVTNYLTRGGFYTRNYVTIIPILLIISAYPFTYLVLKIKSLIIFLKTTIFIFLVALMFFGLKPHLENSIKMVEAYKSTWNYKVAEVKANRHIPEDAVVAMHPSVLIRESQKRIPYEIPYSFSLEEFREQGATHAISNLDWSTVDFYWWMTVNFSEYKYFNKPVNVLEETFPALAVRELSDFSIFNVVNPWQAPDSNFIGAVIPEYKIQNQKIIKRFDFEKDLDSWVMFDGLGQKMDRLYWQKENGGSLVIGKDGSSSNISRWISPKIEVTEGEGYLIDINLETDADIQENFRDGFIRVDFFKDDVRISTRLSSRMSSKSEKKQLIFEIPEGANSMRFGFQVYDMTTGNYHLDSLALYSVVILDKSQQSVEKFTIPVDILFPNSHGGL